MIGKSEEKRTEKLLVIAVVTIFLLLLFLTSSNASSLSLNEQHPESNLLEPIEPVDIAQQVDSNELNELIELIEPIEQNETNKPVVPDELSGLSGPSGPSESSDSSDSIEQGETAETVGQTEAANSIEGAAQNDTAGTVESVSSVSSVSSVGSVEYVETNETIKETAVAPLAPASEPYNFGRAYSRNLCVNIVVKNTGNSVSSNIRLEIPLLAELNSPYQETARETYSHTPAEIKRLGNNNRAAVFRLDSLAPGASETITLNYYLNTYPININNLTTDNNLGNISNSSASSYLKSSEKIESDHPDILKTARELTAACKTGMEKARAIYSFVIAHMDYNLNSQSRNAGALAALRSGSGVCEDYASLFAALCRASGVPARVVNGYADPKGTGDNWNLAPGETFALRGYRHSWAEFYLDGAGWIPADPTMNIHGTNLNYFAALPQASHLAQNYEDISLKARYSGGQLSVTWEEELAG
jgi:hypothetical protein